MKDTKYIYKVIEVNQIYRATRQERFKIKSPICVYDLIKRQIGNKASEEFIMVGLNTKNEVVCTYIVTRGSLNASIVHPREVFRTAIMNNCANIIVAHNHPSGDPTPSYEDVEVTKRLMDAGNILGIDVLDHLVIAGDEYVSIRESGHL